MTASQPVNNPSIVWTRFLVAFARLFAYPMREEAAYRGEAFTSWRNHLLSELGGEEANIFITSALQALLEHQESNLAARLMIEELDAFTIYVERLTGRPINPDASYPEEVITVDRPTRHPDEAKEGLEVGKTILQSLKDLLDKLPFSFKAAIQGAIELASIMGKLF